MDDRDTLQLQVSDEIGRFAESYSSFNGIINKLQRQYLTLKDTYTRQSEELQSINRTLQSLVVENRAVTEFLNSILNALSSGVVAVNNAGLLTHINPAARMILQIPEEIDCRQGLKYEEIIQATEGKDFSAVATVAAGKPFDRMEKIVRTHQGQTVTLSVSTSLLCRTDGRAVGAVEMFQDITRLKRMEEELSRMKVLASLGEMAASIAHEIRNPLVGISGFASLLARDLKEDIPRADMARKIVEGVNSINRTIQTLLDFARHEKVNKSEVDLPAYLDLALESFAREYDHPLEGGWVVRQYRGGFKVELDRQLFRQALYNLFKNAWEAGAEITRVTVQCDRAEIGEIRKQWKGRMDFPDIEVGRIIIEDNGPGIPAECLDKIFSPFYSTKEKGNGLGLAIAWKIIKAHGGEIAVTSRPGKGSQFTILLPIKNSM